MLVFFDESGHPHPKDASARPVCVAVCIPEKDSRSVSARLHALKRDIVGNEEMEIKANKLLNRATFRRVPEKRELVEAFFELVRNLPVTIFGIIMERPEDSPPTTENMLPNQFRYLLQRCDLLAQDPTKSEMVTLLFDGEGCSSGRLPARFNSFLYRSHEGRSMKTIVDAPFFVDSKITGGIQIADMAAGTIRLYMENALYRSVPQRDAFLSAVKGYYRILEEKTKDQYTPDGQLRYGFYRMPLAGHYAPELPEQCSMPLEEDPLPE